AAVARERGVRSSLDLHVSRDVAACIDRGSLAEAMYRRAEVRGHVVVPANHVVLVAPLVVQGSGGARDLTRVVDGVRPAVSEWNERAQLLGDAISPDQRLAETVVTRNVSVQVDARADNLRAAQREQLLD